MRRAARVDANHSSVRRAFEAMGCTVLDLSAHGSGCPDLLVARAKQTVLVEVKDGSKPPSARQLTPDQKEFHKNWNGKIFVVETLDQVMWIANGLCRE